MNKFESNFISNEESRASTLTNPSSLYTIWPVPKHALDFKFPSIEPNKLTCHIQVEYGIIGKFKIPASFGLSKEKMEKMPGQIFTQEITLSKYEINSEAGYFDRTDFDYCIEIENELCEVTKLAVQYNNERLKLLLVGELKSYKTIEMTEGFIRTAVRQLFFGHNN